MTTKTEQQDYKRAFGTKLRAARTAAKVGRNELARRLAIADATQISRWESGVVMPRTQRVAQIAQALGCELSALVPDPTTAGTEDSPNGIEGKTATD